SDLLARKDLHSSLPAFRFEQPRDVLSRAVAKQLSQSLFVVRDPVALDQSDEVRRSKAGQGRLGKVRIGREKVVRPAVHIGEITAAAARNQDLLPRPEGALEHAYPAAALAGRGSAK